MYLKSSIVNDTRLTYTDIGVYARICAFEGGHISELGLEAAFPRNSRFAIRTSLRHLAEFGYLKRHQARVNGKLSHAIWEIVG